MFLLNDEKEWEKYLTPMGKKVYAKSYTSAFGDNQRLFRKVMNERYRIPFKTLIEQEVPERILTRYFRVPKEELGSLVPGSPMVLNVTAGAQGTRKAQITEYNKGPKEYSFAYAVESTQAVFVTLISFRPVSGGKKTKVIFKEIRVFDISREKLSPRGGAEFRMFKREMRGRWERMEKGMIEIFKEAVKDAKD